MWEKLWQFLTTPPNKPEIPFFTEQLERLNNATSGWLSKQILEVTHWLATLLLYTPTEFLESKAFKEIHGFISSISYALTVPAVMWIGWQNITGKQSGEDSIRQVARFIWVPLGIHLLPTVVLISLKLFNALTQVILSSTSVTPEQVLNPGVFSVTMLIFLLLYVWLAVQLVRYYCYRNFALVLLLAFSPIILLTWAIDGGTRLNKWKDELIGLLTTQVVHAIELVILVAMTVGAGSVANKGIPILALQVGALTAMVRTPEWLQGYIQSIPDWFPLRQPRLPNVNAAELLRRARNVFKLR